MYIVNWHVGTRFNNNEVRVRVSFEDAEKAKRYFEARQKQFDALVGKTKLLQLELKREEGSVTEKMAALYSSDEYSVFLPNTLERFSVEKYLKLRAEGGMCVIWNHSL